jgi:hypothetical protein
MQILILDFVKLHVLKVGIDIPLKENVFLNVKIIQCLPIISLVLCIVHMVSMPIVMEFVYHPVLEHLVKILLLSV